LGDLQGDSPSGKKKRKGCVGHGRTRGGGPFCEEREKKGIHVQRAVYKSTPEADFRSGKKGGKRAPGAKGNVNWRNARGQSPERE